METGPSLGLRVRTGASSENSAQWTGPAFPQQASGAQPPLWHLSQGHMRQAKQEGAVLLPETATPRRLCSQKHGCTFTFSLWLRFLLNSVHLCLRCLSAPTASSSVVLAECCAHGLPGPGSSSMLDATCSSRP